MAKLLIPAILLLAGISQAFKIQPRIINGVIADVNLYPFFVFIEDGEKACGGSLLNEKYVANFRIFLNNCWFFVVGIIGILLTFSHCY